MGRATTFDHIMNSVMGDCRRAATRTQHGEFAVENTSQKDHNWHKVNAMTKVIKSKRPRGKAYTRLTLLEAPRRFGMKPRRRGFL